MFASLSHIALFIKLLRVTARVLLRHLGCLFVASVLALLGTTVVVSVSIRVNPHSYAPVVASHLRD